MANCKVARLSKKEVKFIRMATNSEYGVYDFENTSSSEFRKSYGIKKEDVHNMLCVLQSKMDQLLTQFGKESNNH